MLKTEYKKFFPEIVIVTHDDDLDYWDPALAEKIERIESVYLVDLTDPGPHHWHEPLYPNVYLKPEYEALRESDENLWILLVDEIDEGWRQGTEGSYRELGTIKYRDKMSFRDKKDYIRTMHNYLNNGKGFDLSDAEEQARRGYMESCLEYHQGNHVV